MRMWPEFVSRAALAGVLLAGAGGCGRSGGAFVWIDDVPTPRDVGAYTIAAGDLLHVQVWDHDNMSGRMRVRSDGRISVPLLNDATAAGKTPEQLARDLETYLRNKSLVVDPRVTVVLEETKPLAVAVMGEVVHAGMYTLSPGAGVAEALASAGGLTEFAHRDRIFVVRRTPELLRIRFTYSALVGGSGKAPTFRLQNGDVVVTE
jgi:polysaccharide biosynthesis/export protein